MHQEDVEDVANAQQMQFWALCRKLFAQKPSFSLLKFYSVQLFSISVLMRFEPTKDHI